MYVSIMNQPNGWSLVHTFLTRYICRVNVVPCDQPSCPLSSHTRQSLLRYQWCSQPLLHWYKGLTEAGGSRTKVPPSIYHHIKQLVLGRLQTSPLNWCRTYVCKENQFEAIKDGIYIYTLSNKNGIYPAWSTIPSALYHWNGRHFLSTLQNDNKVRVGFAAIVNWRLWHRKVC